MDAPITVQAISLTGPLTEALSQLDKLPDADLEGPDTDVAEALHLVTEIRHRLGEVEATIQAALVGRIRVEDATVGRYRLERRGGAIRKRWQSDRVFSDLVRRANVDAATGEVLDDTAARERLIAAVTECVPLTGSLGWRTRALRAWGIDPDDYCEKSPASFRFEVHVIDVQSEVA